MSPAVRPCALLLLALSFLSQIPAAAPVYAGVAPTPLAANLGQINHLLVDDTHVYWTEVTRTHALIRKMAKGGGVITDLASEPVLHQGQVASYIHLQQMGGRLFWSRLSSGFVTRWTLWSVPKDGGAAVEVVGELTAQSPLLAGAWRVAGEEVLVSLVDPDRVDLPDSTRIGAYNPDTGIWRTALSGQLRRGAVFILAAEGVSAWTRGLTNNDETEIGHLDLSAGDPVYTELLHLEDEDRDVDEPGATDGTHLFYWTRLFNFSLRKLPLGGGPDSQVVKGTGTGLVVSEGFLYWVKGKTLSKRAVDGTQTIKHFKGVFDTAALGGLACDGDFLYLAQRKGRSFSVVRIDK